ncbi:hypothetical protein BH09BAC4_BH09BAC4_33220 [soil metagenome]
MTDPEPTILKLYPIMFGLDPLSRPVAIAEILLLLAFVAFIGWLLGRLMLASRVTTLRLAIDDKKAELDTCRSEKVSGMAAVKTTEPTPFKPVYPYEAEDVEPPHLFVSADPLLPAYSHEDTPAPIVNDELAADIMDASATEADETPAPVTYHQEESEPETSLEAPHLFVSADPLLPIYSHDDTPELLVDDTLAAEINEASATVVAEKPTHILPDEAFEPVEVTEPLPVETPQLFVSADPLLPIYSYDDTPSPLVNDDLADEINDASPPVIGEKLSLVGSAFEFPTEEESNVMESTPAVEDRETIVLNRIKSRISEVNFDRIGRATAAQADDLKDIVGVGPFLERKLHTLGIYTFRQVANFTKEDIAKINEIIEFFPGRIEGDNWVGQSKAFYERKYGAKS